MLSMLLYHCLDEKCFLYEAVICFSWQTVLEKFVQEIGKFKNPHEKFDWVLL